MRSAGPARFLVFFFWGFIVKYRHFAILPVSLVAGLYSAVSAAAVDATITTALSDASTDSKTVGSAVLVVLVGIAVFKYMRKAL